MRHLVWALALCFCAATSQAALVSPLTIEQQTHISDSICVGRVLSSTAHFSQNKRLIITDHLVEVETSLKGTPYRHITVQTAGGVVGDIGQLVHGSAQLLVGEKVLLFLEQRTTSSLHAHFIVVGMAQGKLHIAADSNGDELAFGDVDGLAALDPQQGTYVELEARPPIKLSKLLVEIRGFLKTPSTTMTP